jgi:hypothetical protein
MKTMTTCVASLALLLSAGMNSVVLHADELLTRQQIFVPDEAGQQWVNERHGRDGVLEVHGALLSSPCTLRTNEIPLPLPLPAVMQSDGLHTPLSLELTGCGYGDPLTAKDTPAGRTSVIVAYSALLTGESGGNLQPAPAEARVVLHGGAGRLTWYLSDAQRQLLTPSAQPSQLNTVLRLRLDYE